MEKEPDKSLTDTLCGPRSMRWWLNGQREKKKLSLGTSRFWKRHKTYKGMNFNLESAYNGGNWKYLNNQNISKSYTVKHTQFPKSPGHWRTGSAPVAPWLPAVCGLSGHACPAQPTQRGPISRAQLPQVILRQCQRLFTLHWVSANHVRWSFSYSDRTLYITLNKHHMATTMVLLQQKRCVWAQEILSICEKSISEIIEKTKFVSIILSPLPISQVCLAYFPGKETLSTGQAKEWKASCSSSLLRDTGTLRSLLSKEDSRPFLTLRREAGVEVHLQGRSNRLDPTAHQSCPGTSHMGQASDSHGLIRPCSNLSSSKVTTLRRFNHKTKRKGKEKKEKQVSSQQQHSKLYPKQVLC